MPAEALSIFRITTRRRNKGIISQRDSLLSRAIQLLCKFSDQYEGELNMLPKIPARYYSSKGCVEYYLVGYEKLLTKGEAIVSVTSHRLDAVIVHRKNGTVYLRSRTGHHLHQIRFSNDEFELALDLLNQSDRKCIRIFAFGGGSLIAPGKSHDKTHNYLSEADIIPRVGSIQLAQLIIRRYEKQKQGLSDEEIIDCLISADADYYLETTESKALAAFYRERKKFYHEEFGKISNLSVLEQSEDSGYWEHSFAVPCYQRELQEIIQQYRHTSCEISLQV